MPEFDIIEESGIYTELEIIYSVKVSSLYGEPVCSCGSNLKNAKMQA